MIPYQTCIIQLNIMFSESEAHMSEKQFKVFNIVSNQGNIIKTTQSFFCLTFLRLTKIIKRNDAWKGLHLVLVNVIEIVIH